MPEGQTSASTSTQPMERRLQVRHRLSDLAYVEIGTGNGGIVLDLSEQGMRLQAVGRIDQEEELQLRFKTPGSQAKISAKAKIVWLSDTNVQAGAHLLDLPPDTQLQIQNWIRLLASPLAPPEESRKQEGIVGGSPRESALESVQGVRQGKWLTLMPEFDFPIPGVQGSAKTRGSDWTNRLVAHMRGSDGPLAPKTMSGYPQESAKQSPMVQPGLKPESQEQGYQARGATSSVDRESDTNPKVSHAQSSTKGDSIPGELIRLTPSDGMITSEPTELPPGSTEHLSGEVARASNLAQYRARVAAYAAMIKTRVTARKPAAIAMIFALCAIVFFSTGTWVGHFFPRRQVVQTGAGQINQPQTIEATHTGSAIPEPVPAALGTKSKRNLRPSPKSRAVENLNSPTSVTAPIGPSADQNAQPDPRLSVGSTSDSPATTALHEVEPKAAVSPEDSASPAPGPRLIGGRELKPSDRFNPSYLSYRVEPTYPAQALQQGIEGVVKIELMIGADGNVRSERLLSGPLLLASAALDAARYWRYFPALLNGQPIESEQEVTIEFRLPRQ